MTVDPASLDILHYPDPSLRAKAEPIVDITDEVRRVASRMIELMRLAEGIGLAAPQVGLPWRLFVCHVPALDGRSPDSDPAGATPQPTVYVNPVLSNPSGPVEPADEGCLSIPDVVGRVLRPPIITISALDLEGRPFTRTAQGLLARCWQHECDHLDGILILDRMAQMDRIRNRRLIRELERA
ncbi:MAG: peptide deformylase [Leptolyngbya sp. PLA2]|nr:peptide deformylase [Leptolyngbya sp. PL-A2]MCQ3941375.1 peptide deformylase [cyanobacterium CYA1]MCZ7632918.1 peptide deformylase [Phycisphaerales bacterium]MDL1904486.1 peptide deformylase [Synechococcales cyanobacterium CNB]GIK19008.1 MAG: peptide deformylase [Planctomycetota bacterium]